LFEDDEDEMPIVKQIEYVESPKKDKKKKKDKHKSPLRESKEIEI
jgi:hypothetical protein